MYKFFLVPSLNLSGFHNLINTTLPALLAVFFVGSIQAQSLNWAKTIYEQDTGPLTAGVVDEAGNLYLASLVQTKPFLGQNGIFSQYGVGDLVLSKWSAAGELLWRREYPGNKVRVLDMAIGPDQSLILTGGFIDTFFVAPGWLEPGFLDISNFFLAKTDLEGNFQWLKTEVSTLGSDHLGVALALSGDRIYVSGYYDAVWTRLAKYDLQGTLLTGKVMDIRTLSDLAFDDAGQLYAAGTASTWSSFDTLQLPLTPYISGYVNYVVKMDTSLNPRWGRTSSYITFDDHPEVEWFDGRVFVLTHDFTGNTVSSASHQLRAYLPDGTLTWADSIPDGPEILDPYHFGLTAGCDRLWLQYSLQGGLGLRAYDPQLQPVPVAHSTNGDFQGSFPFLEYGGDRVVWGSNFRSGTLVINDTLELVNPDFPTGYTQVLASFSCPESSGTTGAEAAAAWEVYPNPATSTIYLKKAGADPIQEASVTVFDGLGRMVGEWTGKQEFPVESWPPGTYRVRILEGKNVTVRSFVIF
jgi:hypothetical protein